MKRLLIILVTVLLTGVAFGQSAITYKVINALDSLTLSKNTTRKQVLPFRRGPVGAWMRQGANGYWYWDSTTTISSVDTLLTRVYSGAGIIVNGSAPSYTIKADTSKLATQYDIAAFITQDTLKTRVYGGAGITVTGSAPAYTITAVDQSATNEGSLSVVNESGNSNNPDIVSNTGGTPIKIRTNFGMGLGLNGSEADDIITITNTGATYPAKDGAVGYTAHILDFRDSTGIAITVTNDNANKRNIVTFTNTAPNTVDTAMTRVYGGTGITVSGTPAAYTITNNVVNTVDTILTRVYGGTNIVVSGSAPNYTITSSDTSKTYLNAGTGITVGGTAPVYTITNSSPNTVDTAMTRVYSGYGINVSGTTAAYTLKADTSKLATQFDINGFLTSAVTSVAAGNGMSFTTITGTGSVAMGTPGQITKTSTNAVTSNSHTHAIDKAMADSSTMGIATFETSDFTDGTGGVIGIDYLHGQAASHAQKGFLTSTDWDTFNSKLAAADTANNVRKWILDAEGDLIVGDDNNAYKRLARGTDGQVLKTISGSLQWANDETGAGGTLTWSDTLAQLATDYYVLSHDTLKSRVYGANPIVVSGSAPAQTVAIKTDTLSAWNTKQNKGVVAYDSLGAYVPKYIVDAAGDLIQGTGNNTVARLAKGSDGQVLKVVSGSVQWSTDETGAGGTLAWSDTLAQLATDYNVATKQNISDTITKDATRYWVTQQGYLLSEVDGNISNEGALSVVLNGGNSNLPDLTSNTSGSTAVPIRASGNMSINANPSTGILFQGGYAHYLWKEGANIGSANRIDVQDSTGIEVISVADPTNLRNKVIIRNISPDQTVSLTGAGILGVSGTYPSFTLTVPDSSAKWLPKSLIDAEGDLIVGDDNNVAKTLARGSDGQVLKTISGSLQWANDETGAGGTLTWSDTLAQLATDYDLRLKQNISDTSTKDATRYWVTQQGYITDGNTNWDNSYGFITQDTLKTRVYGTAPITVSGSAPAQTVAINADTLTSWRTKQNQGAVAYGWGNHASASYRTQGNHDSLSTLDEKSYNSLTDKPTIPAAESTFGTVTSIGTSSPLMGGSITSTGTISIIADTLTSWRTKQNKGVVAYDSLGAYIPKYIVNAAGDLIQGTGNNTVTVLAKGSDGQVLKTISGALQWSTDETGAGGTLTWGDTLAQLATDYYVLTHDTLKTRIYAGTGISVTGSAPAYTVTNTAPNTVDTVLTRVYGSGTVTVTGTAPAYTVSMQDSGYMKTTGDVGYGEYSFLNNAGHTSSNPTVNIIGHNADGPVLYVKNTCPGTIDDPSPKGIQIDIPASSDANSHIQRGLVIENASEKSTVGIYNYSSPSSNANYVGYYGNIGNITNGTNINLVGGAIGLKITANTKTAIQVYSGDVDFSNVGHAGDFDSIYVKDNTTGKLKTKPKTSIAGVDSSSAWVPKYVIDAAGDLLYGVSNNAVGRLAKGSDGQVLKTISGALQWATDETGAGGTLTWGDTLAQLATDYNVALKQNIADTSTKDATRYWVGQQGYLTGNQTITLSGDVTGSGATAITATVVDDSHNHIISNVDNLQDSLTDKYTKTQTDIRFVKVGANTGISPTITNDYNGSGLRMYYKNISADTTWESGVGSYANAYGLGNGQGYAFWGKRGSVYKYYVDGAGRMMVAGGFYPKFPKTVSTSDTFLVSDGGVMKYRLAGDYIMNKSSGNQTANIRLTSDDDTTVRIINTLNSNAANGLYVEALRGYTAVFKQTNATGLGNGIYTSAVGGTAIQGVGTVGGYFSSNASGGVGLAGTTDQTSGIALQAIAPNSNATAFVVSNSTDGLNKFIVNSAGTVTKIAAAGGTSTDSLLMIEDGAIKKINATSLPGGASLDSIPFQRNATRGVTFLRTGTDNVGMGTTAPTANLHIENTSTSSGIVYPFKIAKTGIDGIGAESGNGALFTDINSIQASIVALRNSYAVNYKSDLGFYINNNSNSTTPSTALVERMRITSGGNVGIGTTAPTSRFQVADYINFGTNGNNIFYGLNAGKYETGTDKLIIDNKDRSTEANGRSQALIYGITNATAASQILQVGGGGAVVIDASLNYAADGGSNDTYAITLAVAPIAYKAGMVIYFKANTANTGAATINVNSLGAKTIVKSVNTTLADNDILANMFCHLIYDGTNFVIFNPRTL